MNKQALLIGINQYQVLPELKYARQDAKAIADSLQRNYSFSDNEVMLLTDDRPGLFKPTNRYIIQEHLEKLANQELDLFIFGFWGHGVFCNEKRYLCPLDVMANRAEQQGLSFDELQELLSRIKAKNTCLILDCCQKAHDRGVQETLTAADQTALENAARDIIFRRKETSPEFISNVAILNSCNEGQS
ncbi:MAG: caspase family protein, partial [Thermoguttaceae bacterium]|nr:caspase family protein [Thermoguttaceae bacterium]